MARKALLVIDMLVDFVDEEGALFVGPTAKRIVPFVKKKIEEARENGDLVIYVMDSHKPNDEEFKLFPKHSVKGTRGAEVIPELKPARRDRKVRKRRYSGFYGTNLDEILKKNKIKQAEVVGVCTSICVMDTVGGLRNRDYPVTVYKRGVADFDQKFHRFSLERMKKIYGAEVV